MNRFKGTCTLTTSDTTIEKSYSAGDKIDDWCLGEAIARAIFAFDAANPSNCSSTLQKRVLELLKEKS